MVKTATVNSEEGFVSTASIRDYDVTLDAGGEAAPDTLESLIATYAACYVPALRVGGQQRGVEDLGHIQIEVTGDLNEDDKLDSIHFEIQVAADINEAKGDEIIERASELCKVHDALKDSLHAEISIAGTSD